MTPAFRILHHDQDITARIADRLLDVRITDEAGITADQFELTLDNRDQAIALPGTGEVLVIELGYVGESLYRMGSYTVDEIESSGLPRTLRLCGKSADMKASLKSGKKRDWRNTTIGKIVSTIAGEHGLTPRCAARFANERIKHVEQVYESDLHILTRLAEQYGALMKPAGGALLFIERGAGVDSQGHPLPTLPILPAHVVGDGGWSAAITERQHYTCVCAHLRQPRQASERYVYAGNGEPILYLRHPYPSAQEALIAAQAALRRLQRGRTRLSLNLTGLPALCAEMPIMLSGFDALADGEWIVTRAEHQLDSGGFTTSIEAQRRDDLEEVPPRGGQ